MNNNNKNITNEELARMIAEGFADTARKEDVATKHDIKEVRQDIKEVRQDIKEVRQGISELDERLTIVENKLDKALYHEFERVDKLEKEMKVVWNNLDLPKMV